jgi:hypothetical protein
MRKGWHQRLKRGRRRRVRRPREKTRCSQARLGTSSPSSARCRCSRPDRQHRGTGSQWRPSPPAADEGTRYRLRRPASGPVPAPARGPRRRSFSSVEDGRPARPLAACAPADAVPAQRHVRARTPEDWRRCPIALNAIVEPGPARAPSPTAMPRIAVMVTADSGQTVQL